MSEIVCPIEYATKLANVIAYQIENNLTDYLTDPFLIGEIKYVTSYMGENFLGTWIKILKSENNEVLINPTNV